MEKSDKLIMHYRNIYGSSSRISHIQAIFEEEKKSITWLNYMNKVDSDAYERIKKEAK